MGALTAILAKGAARHVDRLRGEVAEARAAEARMIAEAWREHARLPEHYWHARWHAEQRLRSAERMLEGLENPQ
jgi:hypothetical protein